MALSPATTAAAAELQAALAPAADASSNSSDSLLFSALHSLLLSLLRGTLSPSDLVSLFKQAAAGPQEGQQDEGDKLEQGLLDALWQLDQALDAAVEQVVPLLEQQGEQQQTAAEEGVMQVDGAVATTTAAEQPEDGKQREARVMEHRLKLRGTLGSLLQLLIAEKVVRSKLAMERLEPALLSKAGLMQDPGMYQKIEVRTRTGMFYKQSKYNLLREESEGYSKLLVELMSSMGPPHSTLNARPLESSSARLLRAQQANRATSTLLGSFDLDPNRILDLVLDVMSDQVVQHHQFFIDFLLASPWAPTPPPPPPSSPSSSKQTITDRIIDFDLKNSTGHPLIAQILGFKFNYYLDLALTSTGPSVPSDSHTPEKLYLAAGLLVRHGLVKLSELWPYLSPGEERMAGTEERWKQEMERKVAGVGGGNALAMAGALGDDEEVGDKGKAGATAGAAGAAQAEAERLAKELKEKEKEERALRTPNQKVALLHALLSLGDFDHSLFLLSQYPSILSAHPDLADLFLRLLDRVIEPTYAPLSVLNNAPPELQDLASDQSTAARKWPHPSQKGIFALKKPQVFLAGRALPAPSAMRSYTFFFADWEEKLPRVEQTEEVLCLLEATLPLLGVAVSQNVGFLTKVVRIIVKDLQTTEERRTRWYDMIRLYLLPSISMLSAHPAISVVLWSVLRLFPFADRYRLYGEWRDSCYKRFPALELRKAEVERETRHTLRRLSSENVKRLGKTLSKIAHTNPILVFTVALNQVMSYDNLIMPVVETARYMGNLGYDVLTWCLLDGLSDNKRSRTKDDGTSLSLWLQSLSTFIAQVFRRWRPMSPSIPVLLQYMTSQLVAGESRDLVVLHELIAKMTGLEPFNDMSDDQVAMLGGGPQLRKQVFHPTTLTQVTTEGRKLLANQRDTTARLADAFEVSRLAVPLLVNIAIQRQACIEKDDWHLKSMGIFFDQCHAGLYQLNEFLASVLKPDQLADLVPDLGTLLGYGIEPGVAFDIARPKLRKLVKAYEEAFQKAEDAKRKAELMAKLAQEKEKAEKARGASESSMEVDETDPSVAAVVAALNASEHESTPEGSIAAEQALVAIVGVETGLAVPAAAPLQPWIPGLESAIEAADKWLPEEARNVMGPAFFVTFWQLGLYELHLPLERYAAEKKRLSNLQGEAMSQQGATESDKQAFSKSVLSLVTDLSAEQKEHQGARLAATKRLTREKSNWFPGMLKRTQRNSLVQQVIQTCIVPRAKMSLVDAVYTAQFIKRMHALDTRGFHTLVFLDMLLGAQIGPVLYSCSENEARNYARFLSELLADLRRWYFDPKLYQTEALGNNKLLGFLLKWPAPGVQPKLEDYLTHQQFRDAVDKWHKKIVTAAKTNFSSGGYMQIKNTLVALHKIAPSFPIQASIGLSLLHTVDDLLANETREDLKVLTAGFQATLKSKKSTWLEDPTKPKPASPVKAVRAGDTETKASPAPSNDSRPGSNRPSPAPAAAPPTNGSARPSRPAASATNGRHESASREASHDHVQATSSRPATASGLSREVGSRQASPIVPGAPSGPKGAASLPPRPTTSVPSTKSRLDPEAAPWPRPAADDKAASSSSRRDMPPPTEPRREELRNEDKVTSKDIDRLSDRGSRDGDRPPSRQGNGSEDSRSARDRGSRTTREEVRERQAPANDRERERERDRGERRERPREKDDRPSRHSGRQEEPSSSSRHERRDERTDGRDEKTERRPERSDRKEERSDRHDDRKDDRRHRERESTRSSRDGKDAAPAEVTIVEDDKPREEKRRRTSSARQPVMTAVVELPASSRRSSTQKEPAKPSTDSADAASASAATTTATAPAASSGFAIKGRGLFSSSMRDAGMKVTPPPSSPSSEVREKDRGGRDRERGDKERERGARPSEPRASESRAVASESSRRDTTLAAPSGPRAQRSPPPTASRGENKRTLSLSDRMAAEHDAKRSRTDEPSPRMRQEDDARRGGGSSRRPGRRS